MHGRSSRTKSDWLLVGFFSFTLALHNQVQCAEATGEAAPADTASTRVMEGLWRLGPCRTSASCLDNEDCIHLMPVRRKGEAHLSSSGRQAVKYCVRVEKNMTAPDTTMCEEKMTCPPGQVLQCRHPLAANRNCGHNRPCVLSAVIGRCIWLKGATASTEQMVSPTAPAISTAPAITNYEQVKDRVCTCKIQPPSSQEEICQQNFNFVVRAKFVERSSLGHIVQVRRVDFAREGTHAVALLSNPRMMVANDQSGCDCPRLRKGGPYLIAGTVHDDQMWTNNSIVFPYSLVHARRLVQILTRTCSLMNQRTMDRVSSGADTGQTGMLQVLLTTDKPHHHRHEGAQSLEEWFSFETITTPEEFWTETTPMIKTHRTPSIS